MARHRAPGLAPQLGKISVANQWPGAKLPRDFDSQHLYQSLQLGQQCGAAEVEDILIGVVARDIGLYVRHLIHFGFGDRSHSSGSQSPINRDLILAWPACARSSGPRSWDVGTCTRQFAFPMLCGCKTPLRLAVSKAQMPAGSSPGIRNPNKRYVIVYFVLSDRNALIRPVPQNAVWAEVGVYKSDFSQIVLDTCTRRRRRHG
jgi:hypothetical protein